MISDVEDLVKACPFCQAVTLSSQSEPLNPIYMSSHTWEYLYADKCGPFSTGEYILKELELIFSRNAYPLTLKTDNSPNLALGEIKNYLHSKGIDHARSRTSWPRSNEEV